MLFSEIHSTSPTPSQMPDPWKPNFPIPGIQEEVDRIIDRQNPPVVPPKSDINEMPTLEEPETLH